MATATTATTDRDTAPAAPAAPTVDLLAGRALEARPLGGAGLARLVDCMPRVVAAPAAGAASGDAAVAAMARVSYGEGTVRVNADAALIRYLLRHRHTSPFEGVTVKLHVRCPVYVARQWMRHRTMSYNEYSQRYSVAPDGAYWPEPAEVLLQSAANRQGGGGPAPADAAARFVSDARGVEAQARAAYDAALEAGIARETARGVLPVAGWTEFYAVANLHNLMHFIALREDSHAQREIREYAAAIRGLLAPLFPACFAAYDDYVAGGVHLTAPEVAALRAEAAGRDGAGDAPERPHCAFPTKREAAEWAAKRKLLGLRDVEPGF